jgi:hypothetical protein
MSQNNDKVRIVHAKYSKDYLDWLYTNKPFALTRRNELPSKAFMRISTDGPWNIHKKNGMRRVGEFILARYLTLSGGGLAPTQT